MSYASEVNSPGIEFSRLGVQMRNMRKKRFVDPAVQGKLVLRLFLHCFMFLATVAIFVCLVEFAVGEPEQALRNTVSKHGLTFLAFLVLAPAFVYDLFGLSNRFVGPILRLRRAMKDLADGKEVQPLAFREADFWKDLAIEFNRIQDRLKAAEERAESASAISAADAIDSSCSAELQESSAH